MALLGAFLAQSVILLAVAITVTGLANAVFGLARHAYLTGALPIQFRARALSTLGGTFRIGLFIGPFIADRHAMDIGAAYAFAAAMSIAAAILTAFLPDVTGNHNTPARESRRHRSVISVLAKHRHVLLTLGIGILVISAARATRQSIVPLWAESIGIDAATTAVIFGISRWTCCCSIPAAPSWTALAGVCRRADDDHPRAWLPAVAADHWAHCVGLVAALMGLGNGISAGIVLTLGADALHRMIGHSSSADGGSAAIWATRRARSCISAVTAVASLAVAAVTMGVLTWAGSGWLIKWVPKYAPKRRQQEAGRGTGTLEMATNDLLVWVDCEMTGLDLINDELIEVAALVTDADLNVLGDGVDLVIKPSSRALEQMGTSYAACTKPPVCSLLDPDCPWPRPNNASSTTCAHS